MPVKIKLSTMECRYIRKDGAIIWVRGAVASVKDNTGKALSNYCND